MKKNQVRVRFAPSPTGMMHLGNVRTALLNYLFAQQKDGTFIIRIEDTDSERNFDPSASKIIQDLTWLNLIYQEGPGKEIPQYSPYFQSQRSSIYQENLDILKANNLVYRCFCTPEELEKKRQRAIALRLPPRYDRTCANLPVPTIEGFLEQGKPFIWRFKTPQEGQVSVVDLAHGTINFDLTNFSDFPLTRADGSFTFIFANCIDDFLMDITHVLRGEDHLTNTANQVLLFKAFGKQAPLYWHLPIICNVDGKKLSKRDFGFSLNDLKNAGFLPEAINNYLAIIGGSFEHEIMDLTELAKQFNFDQINPTGNIRYDVEKLRWINHKWIVRYSLQELVALVLPLIFESYPQAKALDADKMNQLIGLVKTELILLSDIVPAINFYFEEPNVTKEGILEHLPQEKQVDFCLKIQKAVSSFTDANNFLVDLKQIIKDLALSNKTVFTVIRLAVTGADKGPSLKDTIEILAENQVINRLTRIFS